MGYHGVWWVLHSNTGMNGTNWWWYDGDTSAIQHKKIGTNKQKWVLASMGSKYSFCGVPRAGYEPQSVFNVPIILYYPMYGIVPQFSHCIRYMVNYSDCWCMVYVGFIRSQLSRYPLLSTCNNYPLMITIRIPECQIISTNHSCFSSASHLDSHWPIFGQSYRRYPITFLQVNIDW